MFVEKYAKYRDVVSHITILFRKPEKAGYVGEWSTEWREMMQELDKEIQAILARGYGILDVTITKTEPATGIIFAADVTYWNHP